MSRRVVPESGSRGWFSLRTGTAEPPPSLTDVSLRQVGVVGRWPVPAVPQWFQHSGTTSKSEGTSTELTTTGRNEARDRATV
jgi:hypothetical protein